MLTDVTRRVIINYDCSRYNKKVRLTIPFLFPEGTDGLFRVDVSYSMGGTSNPFHAIHYYQGVSGFGNANDLATAITGDYVSAFQPIVSELVNAFSMIITNLGSTTDVFTTTPSFAGVMAGDLLAAWDCWSFRENTGNRLAPYGYKRIGYITEGVIQSGGAPVSGILDELSAYAEFLANVYATGTDTYTPSLVSPANESHDDNLVLSITSANFVEHGHAVGRKTY